MAERAPAVLGVTTHEAVSSLPQVFAVAAGAGFATTLFEAINDKRAP